MSLDRVGGTLRTLLVARAGAWLIASLIGTGILVALVDRGLTLPGSVRAVLLLIGLGVLAWAVRRFVQPAWRLHISRSTLAHRLEQIEPEHTGQIASAVDLLNLMDEPEPTGAIARAGVTNAAERVGGISASRLIRWSGLGGSLAGLAAATVVLLAFTLWSPAMTAIGAKRVLLPWTEARWPTRFGVTDLTNTNVHPIDEALPIRVAIGPNDAGARVRIEWRASPGSDIARSPMTAQPGLHENGKLYERLVDPGQIDPLAIESELRYRVITPDERTPWQRVRLVRPPEVQAASAEVSPPAHTEGAPGLANYRNGRREIPFGDATIGPVLDGSQVILTWQFNTAVTPSEPDTWSDQPIQVRQPDDRTIEIEFTSASPNRVSPRVTDVHGLGVRTPIVAGIDVRDDGVPSVVITDPSADQTVTPDAQLPVQVESSDEIGVTSVRLDAVRWAKPEGSPGAPLEPTTEPETIRSSNTDIATRVELRATIRPNELGARPGDEIVLVGIAMDTRGLESEVRSQLRRLRVVSAEDFIARIRSQLAPVSRLLRRSDESQRELIARSNEDETDPEAVARDQTAVGDSIAAAANAIRELERATKENNLSDPSLESLLRDLQSVLREGEASSRQANRAAEEGDETEAQDARSDVRESLGEAMAMLDRGEDAYLARRAISRLREELLEAQQDTASIGQSTAGKQANELTPAERVDLDRLAENQEELADKAREALEELTRRAESLERDDPAQAEALKRAAETGRASDVASSIQQGGQQTSENQTGQAQQSQQEAIEQLDEMLEQIDSASALRDTALRRKLADLIVSITMLVELQTREIVTLEDAQAGVENAGLAAGMIMLRENTLGVIEDASAALTELRLIAELLRDAENAQSRAVNTLRIDPPAFADAALHEQESLNALERALEEAKRQEEQAEEREQEQRKAALRKAYREALQSQSSLRDDSRPLLGKRLSRRERIESRRLSGAQLELQSTLQTLRSDVEELREAPVFELAHDQLDLLMQAAGDGLAASTPPETIGLDQDSAISLLASLVGVLADQQPSDDEDFQDGGGGEGGGSSGDGDQPLIPPVAELRLLRDMQQAAMSMTRRLDETPELRTDLDRRGRLGDLQRLLAERGTALIERMNQPPTGNEQTDSEPDSQLEPDSADESSQIREPNPLDDGSTDTEPR